jgi:hypothetical protein
MTSYQQLPVGHISIIPVIKNEMEDRGQQGQDRPPGRVILSAERIVMTKDRTCWTEYCSAKFLNF